MPSTADTLLSPDAAAQRLACSRRTVYRLLEQGELDAVRVGRVVRIEQAALDRFLATHRYRPNGKAA